MQFFKTLVSLSALVSLAAAQLQFTFTFTSVTAGQPTNVTYSGDGGSPVTITLREGNPSALSTIGVLTTSATGGSYIWTPDTSLPSASDYALEISQGSTINYSGLITLVGGSSASSSATTTAANSTTTVGALSTGASGSAGTGSNSTISSATLTRGTTTVVTGVTASATGSSSSSTTVSSVNSAAGLSSSLTLVFGVVAALVYFS